MSDDELSYDDEPATGVDRKLLLIMLGGLSVLAVTLAVLQARMKRPGLHDIPYDAGWQTSVEHLNAGWELRYTMLVERVEELAERIGEKRLDVPIVRADNGETAIVERVPPVVEVGPDNAPPGPAAVSL